MEKERKIKVLSLVALIVAVIGLSIAFAALSSVLKVKGSSVVGMADLDVKFHEYFSGTGVKQYFIQGVYNGESYDASHGGQSIASINISDDKKTLSFNSKYRLPGDYIETISYIKNEGNLDAVISSIEYGTPICTSDTGNKEDERIVCDNLVYHADYTPFNGNKVELQEGIEVKKAEENAELIVRITLNEALDKVPSSNVQVSNLSLKINYAQK